MTTAQIILSFVVIWSLCVFLTLPVGIREEKNPSPLDARGAPANIRFGRRLLAAALLALFFTAILYFIIDSHLISFKR
jgi:predicted secreted protein